MLVGVVTRDRGVHVSAISLSLLTALRTVAAAVVLGMRMTVNSTGYIDNTFSMQQGSLHSEAFGEVHHNNIYHCSQAYM